MRFLFFSTPVSDSRRIIYASGGVEQCDDPIDDSGSTCPRVYDGKVDTIGDSVLFSMLEGRLQYRLLE